MKNYISNLIINNKLLNDHPIYTDQEHTRLLLKTGNSVYLFNKVTNKAYLYTVDGTQVVDFTPISLSKYNAQVDAYKARVKAEAAKAERERITQWKREHNEAQNGVKPSVVDNSAVNAPATKNAVLLDAEREDSGFDYRQGEDILSQSEADTYEEVGSDLLVEDKTDLTGFHRGVLTAWESVKGRVITLKDGSRKTYSPYIALTFNVDGTEFTSRAYAPQFNSFKIQANYNHRKLFTYMKDSVALDTLVGETFDLWIKFNELLSKDGEFQAEFYDREGYAMKKRQQNIDAGAIRSNGYSRIVEERATR